MSDAKRKRETPWPWGRSAPTERVEELRAMIKRSEAHIRIERDRSDERIRRIGIKIDGYQEQLEFAEKCLVEELRQKNKELAYRLEAMGVKAIEIVEKSEDQEATKNELEKLFERAKAGKVPTEEDQVEIEDIYSIENMISSGERT